MMRAVITNPGIVMTKRPLPAIRDFYSAGWLRCRRPAEKPVHGVLLFQLLASLECARRAGRQSLGWCYFPHFAALHAGYLWSSRRLKYRLLDQSRLSKCHPPPSPFCRRPGTKITLRHRWKRHAPEVVQSSAGAHRRRCGCGRAVWRSKAPYRLYPEASMASRRRLSG